jgi:hypothetical protein
MTEGGIVKIAFIAGPYKADTIEQIKMNIAAARYVAEKFWNTYAVICPHMNSALFEDEKQSGREKWLAGYLEVLRRCDTIVMMTGWTLSEGAKAEHALAVELGKEIIYEDTSCTS